MGFLLALLWVGGFLAQAAFQQGAAHEELQGKVVSLRGQRN